MTLKNAACATARITTACALGFVTFMLVFATLLPVVVLVLTWIAGGLI